MGNEITEYVNYFIDLHNQGNMPSWEIVSYIIKSIAKEGDQGNFDDLPQWLKIEITNKIEEYIKERSWSIITNGVIEDYAPYAEVFIKKIKI